MKFQKILFALAIASFVFIGCKNDAKKEVANEVKQEIAKGDVKEMAMNISGMTCEIGCAKVIQSKLSKQEGVLEAKVVFNDSIATVKYDGSKTNKASLVTFVNGIADNMYKATETEVKACSTDKKSCGTDCKKECCTKEKACSTDKKTCSADCKKECCKNKEAKSCATDCEKACCKEKKA